MSGAPDRENHNSASDFFKGKCCTYGGTVDWTDEEQSPITRHGYLPFFSEFLKSGELFSEWVRDCPLEYKSNNAPNVRDVLATAMLSVLCGHTRYQHAASLYGDIVAASILGAKQLVSRDSLSRAINRLDEKEGVAWIRRHLAKVYEPLLQEPYVLDIDPTVKPIYGNQEGAEKGYNPSKPGRPSQCYHTYFIGTIRLIVNVDVRPGNETAGRWSHPGLWEFLDSEPDHLRPSFVRGDVAFGNEDTMLGCEQRGVCYLFKLRRSKKVKDLCEQVCGPGTEWVDAGEGWSGHDSELRLEGWSRSRRVIVLRRPVDKETELSPSRQLNAAAEEQPDLPIAVPVDEEQQYEWQILVTDLEYDVAGLAQLYRDRADCENAIDELKNQWGWCGFTSQQIAPTRIMALLIALVYNWWNVFCRLAQPEKHLEAVSSRSSFQIIGRLIKTGNGKKIRLSPSGGAAKEAMEMLHRINYFLSRLLRTATQLSPPYRWAAVLNRAFEQFLRNRKVNPVVLENQWLLIF